MPAVLADWTGAPETLLSSAESLAEMNSAIAGLPPVLRAAFVLRDLEQLSTEETAEALDITPGAVKVRLHRARLMLRRSGPQTIPIERRRALFKTLQAAFARRAATGSAAGETM